MSDTSNSRMNGFIEKYPWPRRRFIRRLLTTGINVGAFGLTRWEIKGRENIPSQGPLLIVGNHAHFLDTVAPIHVTRWPLEFIGDLVMPNAPVIMRVFPNTWQTLKIQQGTPNIEALQAAQAILAQNGVMVIFPEGHAIPGPLRPALPGAAYMALRTGVPILPMGTFCEHDWKVIKTIQETKRRIKITTQIGQVFGPLTAGSLERPSREEIKAAGHLIMTKIAALLPKELRGAFDPETESAG